MVLNVITRLQAKRNDDDYDDEDDHDHITISKDTNNYPIHISAEASKSSFAPPGFFIHWIKKYWIFVLIQGILIQWARWIKTKIQYFFIQGIKNPAGANTFFWFRSFEK